MDTNIESKEKEIENEPAHEEVKAGLPAEASAEAGEKKPKVISVKTAITVAVIIILGSLAFYYKGLLIAATVNGSPVSRLSVISELEKTSGKQTLDAIITKKLLNDAANKKGITVTSDEVNAEVKKIEDQVKGQGGTLEAVLAQQGMTRAEMVAQLTLQKKLEKLLGDKIAVTDDEAAKLLSDNKVVVPKGEEEKYKQQAIEKIRSQKLNDAAGAFVESLRSEASVKYFVNY